VLSPIRSFISRQCAALCLGAALAAAGCGAGLSEPREAPPVDLGHIQFPVSGAPEAQKAFLEGVLWLHSFEYPSARDAFRRAQEIDPDFAMAYWGEAMTYNHPVWREENLEKGRESLRKLADTPEERLAKAETGLEKGFLQAVEILFGEGSKQERDAAYAEAMGRLSEQFPDQLEPKAFYALAVLGTAHEGRDFEIYDRAGRIAQQVFEKNPKHPGATHYVIHAYDDPEHAAKALPAAKAYAEIAPSAPHAQHMPSHIFVALGMWEEAAASNESAWQTSIDRMEYTGWGADSLDYHSLKWLLYSYLQLGHDSDAREQLRVMEQRHQELDSKRTRSHLAYMRAYYLADTLNWSAEIPESPSLDGLPLDDFAADRFINGWRAVERGETEQAREYLAEIRRRRAEAEKDPGDEAFSGGYTRVGPVETRSAQVVELELEALIELKNGNSGKAEDLLRRAVKLTEEMPPAYGPPDPVKPAHELLAEALLAQGQAQDAVKMFQRAVERTPRRARTLLGLARAAREAGDEELARETYQLLNEMWKNADPDLPELKEVRSYAGGKQARLARPAKLAA